MLPRSYEDSFDDSVDVQEDLMVQTEMVMAIATWENVNVHGEMWLAIPPLEGMYVYSQDNKYF